MTTLRTLALKPANRCRHVHHRRHPAAPDHSIGSVCLEPARVECVAGAGAMLHKADGPPAVKPDAAFMPACGPAAGQFPHRSALASRSACRRSDRSARCMA